MSQYVAAMNNFALSVEKHKRGEISDEELESERQNLARLYNEMINDVHRISARPRRARGPNSKSEEERKKRRAEAQRRYAEKRRN